MEDDSESALALLDTAEAEGWKRNDLRKNRKITAQKVRQKSTENLAENERRAK